MPVAGSENEASAPAVAITGTAVITSLGLDLATTWAAVLAGRCGIRSPTALESVPAEAKGVGEAPALAPERAPELAREQRYLWRVVRDALAAAGLDPGGAAWPYPGYRCGVVMGTTLHGIRAGGRYLREPTTPTVLHDFPAAATLSAAIGSLPLHGGALTVCSACASGLSALAMARDLLAAGELDLVVAGGYDPISEYAYGGFDSLRLVASGPQRPFARDRAGMKLGEGYAALVLERSTDAADRGAPLGGQLLACCGSADAFHLSKPHPEGSGAARAIVATLVEGGVAAGDLGLIAAHATATPDNDAAEAAALRHAGGAAIGAVPITAFKSHLGHTLGAAGAVEAVLALEALRAGSVPPIAGVSADAVEPDDLVVVTDAPRPLAAGAAALVTSLGFGGANASALVTAASGDTVARRGSRLAASAVQAAPREVVITGLGVVLPGVVGRGDLQRALAAGDLGAVTGEVEEAAIKSWIRTKRVRRLSGYVKLQLAAAALAVADAGLADAELGADCGALLGSLHASTAFSWDYYARIVAGGLGEANPLLFAEGVPNAASAHLSMMLGLNGPCATIYGSRCAGLDALALAAERIRSGRVERMLVGAAEECSPVVAEASQRLGIDHPQGLTAAGLSLVVEDAGAARRRGARVLGTVHDGARRCRGQGDAAWRVAHDARELVSRLPAERILASAADRRMIRLEGLAGAEAPAALAAVGECFSVRPLLAVACALRHPGRQTVLASDASGSLSALRLSGVEA